MKKFIIMSLTVFTLILVSCKSDQQKCEDEGKIWIAEGEKCIRKEQKECEDKDMAWNSEEKTCVENEQADCESKEGKKWETDKCVNKIFTVLFKSKDPNNSHLLEVAHMDAKQVSIKQARIRKLDNCIKVVANRFKDLKISAGDISNMTVLCDNDDNTTLIPICATGNYEITYSNPAQRGSRGYYLGKVNQANESCTVVEIFE